MADKNAYIWEAVRRPGHSGQQRRNQRHGARRCALMLQGKGLRLVRHALQRRLIAKQLSRSRQTLILHR